MKGRSTRKSYWNFSQWSVRPTSICAPGKRRFTASAITCSAEWRITSPRRRVPGRHDLEGGVLGRAAGAGPPGGRRRGRRAASFASRGPMRSATSSTRGPRRHLERPPIGQSNVDVAHEWLGMAGLGSLALPRRAFGVRGQNGRHGRYRTADLHRVKAALYPLSYVPEGSNGPVSIPIWAPGVNCSECGRTPRRGTPAAGGSASRPRPSGSVVWRRWSTRRSGPPGARISRRARPGLDFHGDGGLGAGAPESRPERAPGGGAREAEHLEAEGGGCRGGRGLGPEAPGCLERRPEPIEVDLHLGDHHVLAAALGPSATSAGCSPRSSRIR